MPPKIHALVQDADDIDPTRDQTVKQDVGTGGMSVISGENVRAGSAHRWLCCGVLAFEDDDEKSLI
jgi:hypothetical protein